jgi:hypothetical protein
MCFCGPACCISFSSWHLCGTVKRDSNNGILSKAKPTSSVKTANGNGEFRLCAFAVPYLVDHSASVTYAVLSNVIQTLWDYAKSHTKIICETANGPREFRVCAFAVPYLVDHSAPDAYALQSNVIQAMGLCQQPHQNYRVGHGAIRKAALSG